MPSFKVGFGVCLALGVALGALASCRDESKAPRSGGSEGEQPPPPADTKINRAHGEVKTEFQHAADKTRDAVNGLQRDIQKGAGRGADALGVRRSAAGIPARTGDAGAK